jgi:hypothetical protein
MFEKTRTRKQINQLGELRAAEKREVAVRRLQAIKDGLLQVKSQYEELRLFLEDRCEVLPSSRFGFAALNIGLDGKVEVTNSFRTEKSDFNHKEFFETPLHAEIPNAKQREKSISHLMDHMRLSSLVTLILISSGLTILAWVGWLTWYDMTTWSKDAIAIFFGSRTGEAMSLGIGMKAIYYFVASVVLLLSGLIKLLRRRRH